jgi:hypothetical protein
MGMSSTVTTSRYDACTQSASLNERFRSEEMTGRATARMLESKVARKTPIDAMTSTRQRRRLSSEVCWSARIDWSVAVMRPAGR